MRMRLRIQTILRRMRGMLLEPLCRCPTTGWDRAWELSVMKLLDLKMVSESDALITDKSATAVITHMTVGILHRGEWNHTLSLDWFAQQKARAMGG